jgi:hypothetical protein
VRGSLKTSDGKDIHQKLLQTAEPYPAPPAKSRKAATEGLRPVLQPPGDLALIGSLQSIDPIEEPFADVVDVERTELVIGQVRKVALPPFLHFAIVNSHVEDAGSPAN